YANSKNIVNVQIITNISQNEEYLQGESLKTGEEGKLKTFLKSRILSECGSLEEAEDFVSRGIDTGLLEICAPKPETFDVHFTGFKKDEKTNLEELAIKAGMVVRKSVTKGLKLLCYGYNASSKKMAAAREMGIIILNSEQFSQFLDTGDFTESQ
ncbi:hypothetical protein BRP65_05775, partial [Salmonella enterica]|nr:hypothetical protein [Salmonella enterica]ECJ9426240.1 hypothetical protein [Salmonella enterica]EDT8398689.1 hypothetical protein [Salmonella enterica subsp. enterica serovar Saintpaul]EGF9475524.1 hypothetical protein [Salmonella enterica]